MNNAAKTCFKYTFKLLNRIYLNIISKQPEDEQRDWLFENLVQINVFQ